MSVYRVGLLSCSAIFWSAIALAQTPYSTLTTRPREFKDPELLKHVSVSAATIANPSDAGELLNATLKKELYPTQIVTTDEDFFALVHVVRWTSPKNDEQEVQAQNWYVYHGGNDWTLPSFTSEKRLLGVKRAWILYIHLNVMKDRVQGCASTDGDCSYQPQYVVFVKQKLPANAANAVELIKLFRDLESDREPEVTNIWGGGPIAIDKVPSDVTIQPNIFNGKTAESMGDPQVFDNEGFYLWDVSFGVPVRGIKELTIDNTAGTATPKEIEKQRLFALLNIFFQPVDLKTSGLRSIPHLVVGAGFAKRPLDRILVGAGWGPVFTNLYAGALFVRQPKDVSPEQKYKAQFAVGVNLPVRGMAEKLKPKK